ncbi:DUF3549 family protein, partial [Paraglaciecola sp.]|uniref:DUF3549 family protein n=1 Tax=Paraglaciecola sp. TaxID=1920173 RepID=UPI003EF34FDD
MSNIDTISEFLLHAGTDYRIFDMARGIRPINSQAFLEIENGTHAAPYPRQQHIWFGVLFFNKEASKEQYIWFVKLPIDEQGLVIAAGRRQFLQIVIEALGQHLDKENNSNNQLPENPFTFVPNQQQLADFNSRCRKELGMPQSEHFEKVREYLEAPQNQDWQNIPLQGIADFCAVINTKENTQLFIEAFKHIAPEMQKASCSSLENNLINDELCAYLIDYYHNEDKNLLILTSVLRAISQSQNKSQTTTFILQLLNSTIAQDVNVLTIIPARHRQLLNEEAIL